MVFRCIAYAVASGRVCVVGKCGSIKVSGKIASYLEIEFIGNPVERVVGDEVVRSISWILRVDAESAITPRVDSYRGAAEDPVDYHPR